MPESETKLVHADVRYEKSDARVRAIVVFGMALGAMAVVIHLTLAWMFGLMKDLEDEKYPALPRLAAQQRSKLPRDLAAIPEPRLEESEFQNIDQLRQMEEKLLTTYGWVDRKSGRVRIPIEEAMRMLADPVAAEARGIRVRPRKEKGK